MTIEETIRIAVNAHDGQKDYEEYVRNIVLSGNETAIQVKLNDLHHNLWRAKDALETLDTGSRERRELLEEILRIAEIHDRAERYIRNSILRTSPCQDGTQTGRPAVW